MNENSTPTHRDTSDNGHLREKAGSYVEAQTDRAKHRGAHEIESTASAVEESAQGFEDAGQEMLARATRGLADEMHRFSSNIEGRSVTEMVGEIERIARERPAVTLGFAAAAGFAVSRFLTASSNPGGSGNGVSSQGGGDADPLQIDEPRFDQSFDNGYAERSPLSDYGASTAPREASTVVPPERSNGGQADDWPGGAARGQSFTPAGTISPAADLTPASDAATPVDAKMATNADAVAMRMKVGSPDQHPASPDPVTSPEAARVDLKEDDDDVR